jgi:hypothetical protein
MEEKKEEKKIEERKMAPKRSSLGAWMTVVIAVLAVIIVVILISRGNSQVPVNKVNMTDVFDDHGCYVTAGYSWCAPKVKCVKLSQEACEKQDVTSQLCAQYAEVAQANNITVVSYRYDNATNICIATENANSTVVWSVACENDQVVASLEIRNSNITQAQLQQAFQGCAVMQKGK